MASVELLAAALFVARGVRLKRAAVFGLVMLVLIPVLRARTWREVSRVEGLLKR